MGGSLVGFCQAITTFVTSTLGLTLVTAALSVVIAAVLTHVMSWRHFWESVIAGGILLTLSATVAALG